MDIRSHIQEKWVETLLGDFTPHSIAFGLAVGTFVALLPTFGFSALLSLGLFIVFPKINRPAVFAALMIWNPIVQIPIYSLSFHLGAYLYDGMAIVKYNFEILNQIHTFTRRFLVGHMIITIVITCTTYVVSFLILRKRITH